MTNEVAVQEIPSLQRCVTRAREAFSEAGERFSADYNLQDAAVLNVVRACDISIDLANMLIRKRRLGIPTESRESFGILMREKIIDSALGIRLQKMVGFRNLAVHQYRELDLEIVAAVIRTNLNDLLAFAEVLRPEL